MSALEKSLRSFGHGHGSSYGERDERTRQSEGNKESEREEKSASLHERKSREIKASNFLRIVRRISRRTSSSRFLLLRHPIGARRGARRKSARSRFVLFTAGHKMPNAVGETWNAEDREVKGIGWLVVAEWCEEHGDAGERRLPSLFRRNLAFQLFISRYQQPDKILALRFSRICLCPPTS